MDTIEQKGARKLKERRKKGVPNPERENQVGNRKKQSASHRTVLRCSAISPKVTELEDAKGKSKTAMKMTKGRIVDWVGNPDLLRRLDLRSTLFDNYKYLFKFLA
ncbi:hypothetical protein MTR67_035315 [Solanum verrucosum]|uniref:Uncharacterized protein n=1 Tax=Solanum verrucosum TaxID=315347 RepID=A0AAF0ZLF0_SOLVR|nr:hypothetical protein MTR67_035315 [Solanum verrucosum]